MGSAMRPNDHYLNHTSGFASWAFTLDHKRIGVMYLIATLSSFLLGGLAALAVRTELFSRGPTIMDADAYNKMFTLHGAVMIFLFIIPSIPAALGNFILPLMLGAKDVAFPRLNLMSFWLWIIGAAVYIMILPAMGIISEVISIHSRKHIFGYRFIALSSIAIAAFGFLVWGHHMFVSGQSGMANAIFSALTFSVAIPSAIKVFNWLATLYKGDIHLTTAMIYTLMFMITFGIGELPGHHPACPETNIHFYDTYFLDGHFCFWLLCGTAAI